jgi:hypothetical protein
MSPQYPDLIEHAPNRKPSMNSSVSGIPFVGRL